MMKRIVLSCAYATALLCGAAMASESKDRITVLERLAPEKRTNAQRLELARAHYQAARLDQASQLANQVLEADVDNVDAWVIRGDVWREKAHWSQALSAYSRAARGAPNRADIELRRGQALMALGKTREADAAFARYQSLSQFQMQSGNK
jgi:Tfp pilus assembly protein PilF